MRGVVVVGYVAVVLALLPATGRGAGRKAQPCPDGRFLLPAGVVLVDDAGLLDRDAVTVSNRRVEIASGCAARQATVKATRAGTRIGARWPACGARRGVRLKAVVAGPACDAMSGSLAARKAARTRFTAARSACGDGVLDVGEACDGADGCAAGEQCDASCACVPDGDGGGGTAPSPTSYELLDAARAALAAGATDVALSADGRLRLRRPSSASEEILQDGVLLASFQHDGGATRIVVDAGGDGLPEIQVEAERSPARRAVVTFDHDGDGTVDRRETTTQSGADQLTVEIEAAGGAASAFSTSVLQASAGGAPHGGACTPGALDGLRPALASAVTDGLACLQQLGRDDVALLAIARLARDGVTLACGDDDACASVDVLAGPTAGASPEPIAVAIGRGMLDGAAACAPADRTLFHEVLHLAAGGAHDPVLDPDLAADRATDPVHACTDVCFAADVATRCACGTCLGTGPCDARCAGFASCGERCDAAVTITAASCPTTPCTCCDADLAACQGLYYVEQVEGRVQGPVGTVLRIDLGGVVAGEVDCPGWEPIACADGSACCRRSSDAQPLETTFTGTLRFPPDFGVGVGSQCACPAPPPGAIAVVAHADIDGTAVADASHTLTCP